MRALHSITHDLLKTTVEEINSLSLGDMQLKTETESKPDQTLGLFRELDVRIEG